jgi:hypothetical protein
MKLRILLAILALAAWLTVGCEPSSGGGLEQDVLDVSGDLPQGDTAVDVSGDLDKDLAQPDAIDETGAEPLEVAHDLAQPDAFELQQDTVQPTEPRGFRVSALSVEAPDLCYPTGAEGCQPVNGVVNAYLADALDDADNPLDFLGFFQEFLSPEGAHDLDFGAAICDRDNGVPQSCWFDAGSGDTLDRLSVHYVPQGQCGNGIPAPCFLSDPASVQLDLPFFGITLALVGAEIRGSFSGPGLSQLTGGVIHGLLPLSHASNVQICLQQGVCVLLSDLFVNEPADEVDGIVGWWVTLSLEGLQVSVPAG